MYQMKILILGGNGMIGHKIFQVLNEDFKNTWVLIRKKKRDLPYVNFFNSNIIEGFELEDDKTLFSFLDNFNPDIIINAVGITIRRGVNEKISKSIFINSLLPNLLEDWVDRMPNKRLIHLSTDCVFNGELGSYNEESIPNATDIYGRTKILGEVKGSNTITLRSSMIGRELENFTELFEWVISQKGSRIKGFNNAIYSGITTIRMARYIKLIIMNFPKLSGLFNVSSEPISKYNLIKLLNKNFDLNLTIEIENSYKTNKVLDSGKFFNLISLSPPTWEDLIIELKDDSIINQKFYKNK
jgi:dTDP-4-dehydrorhamnose reductase